MRPETIAVFVFYAAIGGFLFWLYYSTFLPSARYCLRLTLFRQRDRLRQLVIDGKLQETDFAFLTLDTDLSAMISGVSRFDVTGLFQSPSPDEERALNEFIEKRYAAICKHPLKEVREIDRKSLNAIALAFMLNSLIVGLLILPLALIVHVLHTGVKNAKQAFYGWLTHAFSTEEDSAFRRLRAT